MNFLKNKKVIGILVLLLVILFVAFSLTSGTLKFKITATRSGSPVTEITNETNDEATPVTTTPAVQKPILADRATTFKDADSDLEFSINLPLGWATAENDKLDFVAGSLTAEKLPDGRNFYANLNAIIGAHPSDFLTFADYQKGWKDAMLAQYPSMEGISDYSTVIDGIDVYVIEVSNASSSGLVLRQIQYIFYVNDTHALVVTVTAPLNSWSTYDQALKKSVESIKRVAQ